MLSLSEGLLLSLLKRIEAQRLEEERVRGMLSPRLSSGRHREKDSKESDEESDEDKKLKRPGEKISFEFI